MNSELFVFERDNGQTRLAVDYEINPWSIVESQDDDEASSLRSESLVIYIDGEDEGQWVKDAAD